MGIKTALGKETSTLATAGEKAAIRVEEFEIKEAGREAAEALTREAGAAAGAGATSATKAAQTGLFETAVRESAGFFGGIYRGAASQATRV